jgi:aryl-alcohol dehydrogenase-like predicted oxidoreductase
MINAELGCKVHHLALAWVAQQPQTSTVILGASRPEQVIDNLKALEVRGFWWTRRDNLKSYSGNSQTHTGDFGKSIQNPGQ